MDLNGDGNVDILSGSYSRMDSDMAGLFQVLWGTDEGFEAASALEGTDDEPLIIPTGNDVERICTRPTAADLNGDGKLDIVSGNFTGSFFLFHGEGEGRFVPDPVQLNAGGSRMKVPAHSDPFLVDWDSDGDLDLVSGSGQGGVFLCRNEGTATEHAFAKPVELIEPVGYGTGEARMGDAFLKGPQTSTRVWVDDLDGDGKLDLLVGDTITLFFPADGLTDEEALAGYEDWLERQSELMEMLNRGELDEEETEDFNTRYTKLMEELAQVVRSEPTGFVWAYYQQ